MSCSSKTNICFLFQRKHCVVNHSGTCIQPKYFWKKTLRTNFINQWLLNIYKWHAQNTKSLICKTLKNINMQTLPNNSTRLIGNLEWSKLQWKFTGNRKKNKLEWRQKKESQRIVDLDVKWKDCNKNDAKK